MERKRIFFFPSLSLCDKTLCSSIKKTLCEFWRGRNNTIIYLFSQMKSKFHNVQHDTLNNFTAATLLGLVWAVACKVANVIWFDNKHQVNSAVYWTLVSQFSMSINMANRRKILVFYNILVTSLKSTSLSAARIIPLLAFVVGKVL